MPRPPQGQPVVAALAHQPVPFEFAATSADVVFVTPRRRRRRGRWVADVRDAEARGRAGRAAAEDLRRPRRVPRPTDDRRGRDRKARLDELDGRELPIATPPIFVGTPDELADQLVAWQAHGLDGFRLRPGVIGHDLDAIVDGVVPALQRRGAFRTAYEPGTLRERLGLGRPASRYARSCDDDDALGSRSSSPPTSRA